MSKLAGYGFGYWMGLLTLLFLAMLNPDRGLTPDGKAILVALYFILLNLSGLAGAYVFSK